MRDQNLECFHQSFQGAGSIYFTTHFTNSIQSQLERYTVKAILLISAKNNYEIDPRYSILWLSSEERNHSKLQQSFQLSQNFIEKARKHTNILILSPTGRSHALTFGLAYLMQKYNYDLDHITRLLGEDLDKTYLPQHYMIQLSKISLKIMEQKEEEENQLIRGSSLGRRIVRIRKEYGKIAQGSRFGSLSKIVSKELNPELGLYSENKIRKSGQISSYRSISKKLYKE